MSFLSRFFAKPVPPATPEIGCFTQGLIKSLIETPDAWIRISDGQALKHHETQIIVIDYSWDRARPIDITITRHEEGALGQAVERRSQILRDKANAPAIKHFTDLGCPPQ